MGSGSGSGSGLGFLCVVVAVATPRVSCAVRTCCMPWCWDQHAGGDGTRKTKRGRELSVNREREIVKVGMRPAAAAAAVVVVR